MTKNILIQLKIGFVVQGDKNSTKTGNKDKTCNYLNL